MDRLEPDTVSDLRFVIDELGYRFEKDYEERFGDDRIDGTHHNGTPEADDDPYFDLHTFDGPF